MASTDQEDVRQILWDLLMDSRNIKEVLNQMCDSEDDISDSSGGFSDSEEILQTVQEMPTESGTYLSRTDEIQRSISKPNIRQLDSFSDTADPANTNTDQGVEIPPQESVLSKMQERWTIGALSKSINQSASKDGPISSYSELDYVIYGSSLRRNRVTMQDDNRMAIKFKSNEKSSVKGPIFSASEMRTKPLSKDQGPKERQSSKKHMSSTYENKNEAKSGVQCKNTEEDFTAQAAGFDMNFGQPAYDMELTALDGDGDGDTTTVRAGDQCSNGGIFTESQWVDFANREMIIAREKSEEGIGLDTVICLDISQSMAGEPWKQALGFINGFLDDIMNHTCLRDEGFERIGLVTFGHENCVQHYMSCDLISLKQKIGKLTPGGKSPLEVGLLLSYALVSGSCGIQTAGGLKLSPRLFLVTDGNITTIEESYKEGPDVGTLHGPLGNLKIWSRVIYLNDNAQKVNIFPVPVGDCNQETFLKDMADLTGGEMVSTLDYAKHASVYKNFLVAAKINTIIHSPLMAGIVVDDCTQGLSHTDLEQVKGFLEHNKIPSDSDNDSDDSESDEYYSSPPLGSRIQLARPRDEHKSLVGTVVKHFKDGQVGITLDDGGHVKVPSDNLRQVNIPRRLHGELIEVGCRVKRGPDWRYPNQDGGDGGLGYVFKVRPDGIVSVRWDNGNKNIYRFGSEGCFDLVIINPDGEDNLEFRDKFVSSMCTVLPSNDIKTIEEEMNRKKAQMTIEETDTVERMNRMNLKNAQNAMNMQSKTQQGTPGQNNLTEGQKSENPFAHNKSSATGVKDGKTPTNKNLGRNSQTLAETEITSEAKKALSGKIATSGKIDVGANTSADGNSQTKTQAGPSVESVGNGERLGSQKDSLSGSLNSTENGGARPKIKTPQNVTEVDWLWKGNDMWHSYPEGIKLKIEEAYQRKTDGSIVIKLENQQYRISFKRMKQIHITTREKTSVKRNAV